MCFGLCWKVFNAVTMKQISSPSPPPSSRPSSRPPIPSSPPGMEKYRWKRGQSNSLSNWIGASLFLTVQSEALFTVANCSEQSQSAYQNCNIVGQYCNVACKRTSGLSVNIQFDNLLVSHSCSVRVSIYFNICG